MTLRIVGWAKARASAPCPRGRASPRGHGGMREVPLFERVGRLGPPYRLLRHRGLLRALRDGRVALGPAGGLAIGEGDAVDHRLVEDAAGDLHGERDALLGES